MTSTLLEDIRFGYGPFGSQIPAAGGINPDRLLAQLDGADPADRQWRRPDLAERLAILAQRRAEILAKREGRAVTLTAGLRLREITAGDLASWVPRAATTTRGFRERLVNLWANRLTVAIGKGQTNTLLQSYRDEAIRPHVAGRFADMLAASLFHPAMLIYLDQTLSVGPTSPVGIRRGIGLNENLAREFLELHSMGSGYTQNDVTELARLLAGLTLGETGTGFQERRAEQGAKTILGSRYDNGEAEIRRLIERVALRPETASSIARMLASHFLSDTPPEPLVRAIAASYLDAGGDLRAAYVTLLADPAAADPVLRKIRSPHEYVAATLRALDMTGLEAGEGAIPKAGLRIAERLRGMGQPTHRPRQPDGWPDTGADWLTPPMLATRIDWAVTLPRRAGTKVDPGLLCDRILGDLGQAETHQAVRRAEQRWEGVAVLFASPDFMRR